MSLLELLVALLAVALVLSATVSGYQRWLLQSRRALAWSQLLQVQARQDHFYLETGGYAQRLSELGYPGDAITIDAQGARRTAGAIGAIYLVELRLEDGEILIRASARPVGADPACPMLQLGQRTRPAARRPVCR